MLAALLERGTSGRGQVIDAAIVDGAGSLTAATLGMLGSGRWHDRGANVLDGGTPWYRTYRTRDGGFVAVGAIEPQFYAELLGRLGLDPTEFPREDHARRDALEQALTGIFASQDRRHWEELFAGTDACVTPVLSFGEALHHPHQDARCGYLDLAGIRQPAPAPRLSRTPAPRPAPPPDPGEHTDIVLGELGRSAAQIKALHHTGAVA